METNNIQRSQLSQFCDHFNIYTSKGAKLNTKIITIGAALIAASVLTIYAPGLSHHALLSAQHIALPMFCTGLGIFGVFSFRELLSLQGTIQAPSDGRLADGPATIRTTEHQNQQRAATSGDQVSDKFDDDLADLSLASTHPHRASTHLPRLETIPEVDESDVYRVLTDCTLGAKSSSDDVFDDDLADL